MRLDISEEECHNINNIKKSDATSWLQEGDREETESEISVKAKSRICAVRGETLQKCDVNSLQGHIFLLWWQNNKDDAKKILKTSLNT